MTAMINGRTHDEIKKGLEICFLKHNPELSCAGCPYGDMRVCGNDLGIDTLAYIQQLERERDAAVEQLKEVDRLELFCCSHCKHEELDEDDFYCTTCIHMSNWQWRGAQNDG